MDLITLFKNTCNELIINNCYISIDCIHGNTLIYSIFNEKNEFIIKANEFTNYLKNYYFDNNENMYVYYLIDTNYNSSMEIKDEAKYIDEDVFCFITAFSSGTTHGYSSLLDLYLQYTGNKKVIVYKGTQKGILDLLYLFINKDNIIYLENNNYYKFKSIEFIDIKRHIFNTNTDIEQLDKFINKYIIYTKEKENERIGIFKTNNSKNLTSDGTITEYKCLKLCNLNNINRIKPENLNEIDTIKILKNTKCYITTFGTSFTKNIYYLSNNCKRIIVLVIGPEHNKQIYSRMKLSDNISIPLNFRNIKINYILIDNYRTFNLDDIPDYNFIKLKNGKLNKYIFNFDELNLENYKNNYLDLKNLSDTDLLTHYNTIGKKENRIHEYSFKDIYINTEIYLINYPDLSNLSDFELKQHYFISGKKEGRVHEYIIHENKDEKIIKLKEKIIKLKEEIIKLKEKEKENTETTKQENTETTKKETTKKENTEIIKLKEKENTEIIKLKEKENTEQETTENTEIITEKEITKKETSNFNINLHY